MSLQWKCRLCLLPFEPEDSLQHVCDKCLDEIDALKQQTAKQDEHTDHPSTVYRLVCAWRNHYHPRSRND